METCKSMEYVYVLEKRLGGQFKPCIIHGGNLKRTIVSIYEASSIKKAMPIVNKRTAKMLIVCLSCHFGMGLLLDRSTSMSWGRRYPVGVLNDTCILTMTRTYLGPKLSSMRFRYSYSRGTRFSTCDLSSI